MTSQHKIHQESSFCSFVYPFAFESKKFESLSASIDRSVHQKKDQAVPVWESVRFDEDDLLPVAVSYLNPSADNYPCARLWRFNNALRDVFGFRADWTMKFPKGEIGFSFGTDGQGSFAVQLAMFKIGVGFLTLYANPKSDSVSDWLNFIHYFRFIDGKRDVSVTGSRRCGLDPVTRQPMMNPFFPQPSDEEGDHLCAPGMLKDLISMLLHTAASGDRPWWKEVFIHGQTMPFTALFADFSDEVDIKKTLYKFRNFFHAEQTDIPSDDDLNPDPVAVMPYVKDQWFVFSREGGGFFAANPPDTDFFRHLLPYHIQNQYFLLFQMALHQRFGLMKLSERVADAWATRPGQNNDARRETIFEEIHEELLLFTAKGYFTQIMQKGNHHRCYQKWQDMFQLQQLYEEISDEV